MTGSARSRGLPWVLLLAAGCLAVAGCDVLNDDDSSAPEILPGTTDDILITLTWTNAADLDLHVTDPFGVTIYFAHPSSVSGGELDVDNLDGSGPERVSWETETAPEGSYEVKVDHFSGPAPTGFTVEVRMGTEDPVPYTGTVDLGQMVSVVTFEYELPLPPAAGRVVTPVARPKDIPTRKLRP